MNGEPRWLAELRDRRRGRRIGGRLRYLEEVGSTNDEAREWLDQGGEDGLVVVAGRQTRGRGRRGRSWNSPPGGLYLSVGLRPRRSVAAVTSLTFLGAVATTEVLRDQQVPAVIRWPNDVDVDGGKVAGVLVECRHEGARIASAVLGLGVNLAGPRGPVPGAAVVAPEEMPGPDAGDFADRLLNRMELWYTGLASGSGALMDRLRELCPGAEGRRVLVEEQGERYEAVTCGLAGDGALRLRRPDGQQVELRMGELARLREA